MRDSDKQFFRKILVRIMETTWCLLTHLLHHCATCLSQRSYFRILLVRNLVLQSHGMYCVLSLPSFTWYVHLGCLHVIFSCNQSHDSPLLQSFTWCVATHLHHNLIVFYHCHHSHDITSWLSACHFQLQSVPWLTITSIIHMIVATHLHHNLLG